MSELENDIKELELEINTNNSNEAQRKLAILKAKYNTLSNNKASAGLIRLKQTYCDHPSFDWAFILISLHTPVKFNVRILHLCEAILLTESVGS